jgi:hypothetical protein
LNALRDRTLFEVGIPISSVVLAALMLLTGCQSVYLCKQGTVLIIATFDDVTSSANEIEVDVTVANGSTKRTTLVHAVDMSEGSIEIDFPTDGYPSASPIKITLIATKNGTTLGTTTYSGTTLSGICSTIPLRLNAAADGGTAAAGSSGTGS